MFEILNYIFAVGINISHIIGYVVSIFAFLFIYKNWKNIKNNKIIIFAFAFLLYGFVRACFCDYTKDAFEEMFTYLTSWLFPFILGYFVIDNNKKRKIINTYIITFTIIIAFSVLAYFGLFYETICGSMLAEKGQRLCGFMWHISCGAICVLASCFALIPLLFKENLILKQKIFLGIATTFFMVCLYLTSSRGYYIAGFVTYFCIFSFYVYKTKKIIIPLTIGLISVSIVTVLFLTNPYMQNRMKSTNLTTDTNVTTRLDSYKVAILIFKDNFVFGVGPRQGVKQDEFYKAMNFTKEDNSRHLHSMWLNVLAEFGSVGFILFCIMIFLIMTNLYYEYKHNNSLLSLCMLFAWISLLIGDCFDTVLRGPRVAMDYFWLTGLILAKSNNKTETK